MTISAEHIEVTEPAEYIVETGVHGATRIVRKSYTDVADALKAAQRWSRSNSQGHYWAAVSFRDEGERNLTLLAEFNLTR